jgi:hypothetical protein
MNKIILSGVIAVTLTACVTPPLEMAAAPQSMSLLAGAPMDRIRTEKTELTTIRAFKSGVDENGKAVSIEVPGAKCSLESDHLRGQAITPQKVILPKYDQSPKLKDRGVPPSILVKCTSGELAGQTLLAAKPGKIVSGSGNLFADVILMAGSAIAAATADWRYETDVRVNLK